MTLGRAGRLVSGFPPIGLALVVLAWVCIIVWDASPYGRYLHHGDWSSLELPAAICSAVPASTWVAPTLLYAGGWVLMTAAMMLPTVLPLMRLFDLMTTDRPQRAALHLLLTAGYLLTWAGLGIIAHVLDRLLHMGLNEWAWLAGNAWVAGAIVLALAGVFQFSALKYHCLDRCRTPLGFLTNQWSGRRPYRDALTLGIMHGMYCVGCCWALMLLSFVIGMGNLGWMLALGLVMAIEKNHRWGRRISAPLGCALVLWATVVVVEGLNKTSF